MAYTVEDTPRVIDFALNPIGFKLNSSRTRYFRFYFYFLSAPPIGSYLEIKWSNKTVKYDVVDSADNSGTQLTSTTNLSLIAADLNKNTLFSNTWQHNSSGPRLGFFEKNIEDYFVVEINCPSLTFDFYTQNLKFDDPQKMVSELFVKHYGDSNFKSKGLAFHSFDFNGDAIVNLKSRLINGFKPYLPTIGYTAVTELPIIEYYLKLWELHPNDAVSLVGETTTDHFFALFSKLPYKTFPTYQLTTPIALLTNAYAWRETWKDAHQELTVLVTSDIASFAVKAILYFDDETDDTVDVFTVNCSQNKSYFLPVGYDRLNIDSLNGRYSRCLYG
jgi:hypothetical protein